MRAEMSQVLAGALFFVLAAGYALAESASASSQDPAVRQNSTAPTSTASTVPLREKGTWDLSVWAREEFGNSAYGDLGDDLVSMAGFRAGYVFAGPAGGGRLRGTLEYFFDVIPVFVLTKPQVIYGGGFSPVGLKWNFINGRYQPFLEASLGAIFSTRDVPPGNTSNFNFTVSAGGGAALCANERHALTANVGFWHLSNAHIGRNNPSLNAVEVGIEYHWFRPK
jgi:hypothetical protein